MPTALLVRSPLDPSAAHITTIGSSHRGETCKPYMFLLAARLAVALLVVVTIAGCDSEPTQRKAFIEFLQTRIVGKPGVHVPKLTQEETASFGDYAKHYAVIADFNAALDKSVSQPLRQTMAAGAPHSLSEVVARRKDVATMREGMATIRGALDKELATADAAHAALKQPADLKPIYDAAYDRDVTQPAKAMVDIFPDVDAAMKSILELADFLDRNSKSVKIEGAMVKITDPTLQAPLQNMMNALRDKQEAIQKAQRRLQEVVHGS